MQCVGGVAVTSTNRWQPANWQCVCGGQVLCPSAAEAAQLLKVHECRLQNSDGWPRATTVIPGTLLIPARGMGQLAMWHLWVSQTSLTPWTFWELQSRTLQRCVPQKDLPPSDRCGQPGVLQRGFRSARVCEDKLVCSLVVSSDGRRKAGNGSGTKQ